MNKDLLSGFDLTEKDIKRIFDLTDSFKKKKIQNCLQDKTVALVFQKPSVRTRVSFETGIYQLGGHCMYLAPQDIKLGDREPVKDVARVLGRYVDMIVARIFEHKHVIELAGYSGINVINGLSDMFHPCQALADIYTIYEKNKQLKKLKLVFVGDGNNVVHSLLAICVKTGLNFTVATPKRFEPDAEIWKQSADIARKNGVKIAHTYDAADAVKDADFVYTDVWTSMGQEAEYKKRLKAFSAYQLNRELLQCAPKKCGIMHCMPMHRGEEITDDTAESANSIIFDQAENRMHVQKAVMAMLVESREPPSVIREVPIGEPRRGLHL